MDILPNKSDLSEVKLEPIIYEFIDKVNSFSPRSGEKIEKICIDIFNNINLTEWANLDLWNALQPSRLEEEVFHAISSEKQKTVIIFEILRNVLIIGPIIVTWLGLSIATKRFSQVAAPGDDFLLLWESGKLGWLTFSMTGFIDLLMLIIVLYSAYKVHSFREINQYQASIEASEIRKNLEDILWKLELKLLPVRFVQNISHNEIKVGQTLSLVRNQLIEMKKLINQLLLDKPRQERIEESYEKVSQSTLKIKDIVEEAVSIIRNSSEKSLGDLNSTYNKIHRSIELLAKKFDGLNTNQSFQMNPLDNFNQSIYNLEEINSSLKNSLETINLTITTLSSGNNNLYKELEKNTNLLIKISNNEKLISERMKDLISIRTNITSHSTKDIHEKNKRNTNLMIVVGIWIIIIVNVVSVVLNILLKLP